MEEEEEDEVDEANVVVEGWDVDCVVGPVWVEVIVLDDKDDVVSDNVVDDEGLIAT